MNTPNFTNVGVICVEINTGVYVQSARQVRKG